MMMMIAASLMQAGAAEKLEQSKMILKKVEIACPWRFGQGAKRIALNHSDDF